MLLLYKDVLLKISKISRLNSAKIISNKESKNLLIIDTNENKG